MNKRILIVDDDGTNRYMMETLLKGYGYDVTTAENGREALEKARRDPPDLIVSDSLMPVMDGYNLCREWKADETLRHIPFALYTATYTDPKDEKFALGLGVDRFIIKPQEPAVLAGMIGELLEDGYRARQVETKPIEEEMQFFRQYNEILFKKLEQKMQDLETANRMLSITEEGYRQTFMNASDVICMVDSNLILRSISPSVERILGYKPQDFVDRPVTEFGRRVLTSESFERAIADVAAVLGGQRIASTVYEFIAGDGAILYGEVSGSPLMREGEITGIVSVARDITAHVVAERALRENEEKYRFLFDHCPDAVYALDAEGGFLSVNDSSCRITGYSREELMRMKFDPLIVPDEKQRIRSHFLKALHGEPQNYETTILRKDGGQVILQVTNTPVTVAGDIVGVYAIAEDITDRVLAEKVIRESEAEFQDLFNEAPVGYFEYDTQGRISRANHTFLEMLGYQPEEVVGQFACRFIEDEKARQQITDKLAGTLAPFRGVERLYRRKDGALLPVLVQDRLFHDEQGRIMGIRCAVQDITEREQARKALEEREKKFRFLTEKMTDMVWTQDMNLRTLYVSPSIEAMLGFTPEERMGQDVLKQLTPESMSFVLDLMAKELALEQQGQADPERKITLELEYYHKDGSTRWLENIISGIRDDRGALIGVHGVSRDITQRKKVEESLENEHRLLQSLIDNIPDRIYVKDLESRYILCNKAMLRRMGKTRMDEVVGKTKFDFLPREFAQRSYEEEQEILRSGKPMINIEKPMAAEDGKVTRWSLSTKVPLLDREGNQIGIVGVGREITDLKRTEKQLHDTLENLRKAFSASIQLLISAVETRDPYTAGHQVRSTDLARAIATEMGLPQDKIEGLSMAGAIHDVGKLSIPAELLSKPTKLTNIEFSLIKEHAQAGYKMLKHVESPWPLAQIVYQHHERMDGSGYPRQLKGDEILMEARILTVADVVEAMASYRPYRPGLGMDAALNEIEKNKGTLYDAEAVDACLRLFREKGFIQKGA